MENTVLGISRRKFVQTSAGAVAAGALLRKRAFAAPRPLKIGFVSPMTGTLAPFAVADAFTVDGIRKLVRGGIQSGGTTRQVEIVVRDNQSNANRSTEIASQLIKSDKVDIVVGGSGSDTTNPISDQCEVNQVPCVTTDNVWQAVYFGRGGTPEKGFDWTYHFFWGVETHSLVMNDVFARVPSNKVVGMLMGDEPVGISEIKGATPVFEEAGFKVFDPGRFNWNITDFSAIISALKNANAEILFGNLTIPVFSTFWLQAAQQNYKPKIAAIAMAVLMPSAVDSLGPRGKYLTTEVWWTPKHPFKSSLTGQSAQQLCDAYEEASKKQWSQTIGFRHGLFEVALDVLKRAQNPESNHSVIEAVRTTKLNTIVGPVQWQGPPPNPWTRNPVKNVCTTPLVGGQWVPGKKWMYDLVVTANKQYPLIPVTFRQQPLPA